MKRRWLISALLLALLMGSFLSVGAQGVVSLSIDHFGFDEFPRVQALVTVRNENGVPIAGLGPEKFEIVEDGRTSFPPSEAVPHTNPDAVVSVVMAIDISGSMRGKPVEEAMRAANALLDQLSVQDRVAIIAFTDNVDVDPTQLAEGKELGFTTDKNAARNVVNFLSTKVGKDTPLYDAIYKGVKMVSTEPVGKRAVIVMTDGKDERDNAQGVAIKDAGSLSSPDDPINEANRHNIPIFSIGLGSKIDAKYLGRLAERTGGVYQQTPEPEELTPLFQNVLSQLKQQYTLTYNSTLPEDNNYHSLLIRVQLPQGQAFAETKVQLVGDALPPAPPEPTAQSIEPMPEPSQPAPEPSQPAPEPNEPTPEVVAQLNPSPPPAAPPTAEPPPAGLSGIIDTVRNTIEEKPLVAAVIGGGVLLLLILIIALLIVLLRGRGAAEEEFATAEYGETYAPASGWMEGATTPGTPVIGGPVGGRTEVATSDWPGAGPPGPAPVAPPFPGMAAGSDIPAAGGTRIIERAPKHLAMLVDKSRPDRKYDLKGTTNVGRSQDNQIILDDPTVSRQHAWVKVEGEDFLVFDIGSANGTFVNDQPVEAPRRLENGDVVRFGEVAFVFTKVF